MFDAFKLLIRTVLLNLFRQNTFFAGVMLFVLMIVLHIPAYLAPHQYEYIQHAPLARLVFTFILTLPNHLFWSMVIAQVLIFLQAVFINFIVTQHSILYKDTLMPALMFVLLNSLFPQQSELTPQLISNTFVILMLHRLCYVYEAPNPLLLVFDAGMYLGIGLLLNYDLALFLPFILVSVVIFTSFNARYLLISLVGMALPLYFTAIIFYLTDNFGDLENYILQSFSKTYFKTIITDWVRLLPWFILLPVTVVSAFNLQSNFFRNKVKTRRIIQSVGLMLLFGIASLFFENSNYIYAICYLSVPLSIVTGYFFISDKRFLLKESMFIMLIILCYYYQLR